MSLRDPPTAVRFVSVVLIAMALTAALSLFLVPMFGQAGGAVASLAVGIGLGIGLGRLLKP